MCTLQGTTPLRDVTNSPLQSPRPHPGTQVSNTSEVLFESDRSYDYTALNNDDGIYNAQRVTDQDSSLAPVCETGHGRNKSVDLYQRENQAVRSNSNITTERHSTLPTTTTRVAATKHRRGWSLNDLDCLTDVKTTASSQEVMEELNRTTTYPHVPPKSPPCRMSTPEGIPSFGTIEAQRLRLVQPSWLHRLGKLLFGRPQNYDENEQAAESVPDTRTDDRPPLPTTVSQQYESPTEMLRRISGITRPISVTKPPTKTRRSSLPRGVKKASRPGDLAMAADGSHVRGRFGQRVSGHGVGPRTIDNHPLARRQGTSAVGEEVHAIDKACEHQLQQEQYRTGMSSTPDSPVHGSLLQQTGREGPRSYPGELLAARHSSFPTDEPHNSFQFRFRRLPRNFARVDLHDELLTQSGIANPPPAMLEPEPYDISHPQVVTFHAGPTIVHTEEDILNDHEQGQDRQETSQPRNWGMEVEIC